MVCFFLVVGLPNHYMIKKKKLGRPRKDEMLLSPFQKKMQSVTNPAELMRLARDIARGQGYDTRPVEEDEDDEYEDEDQDEGEEFDEKDVEEFLPEKPQRRAVSTSLVTRAPDPAPVEDKKKAPAYTRMPWYDYGMSETEAMVIDLDSKGMNHTKINEFLQMFHNTSMDGKAIDAITDKMHGMIKEWQARPLSSQYMVLYLDGFAHKVMVSGQSKNKMAYVAMGINAQGKKEVLGIWLNETEGAKFWGGVLSDIRSRGVQDVLVTCVDGLKGFPDAIKGVFPYSDVQICVVHMIRKTLMHISNKDRKAFAIDLRQVYTARDAEEAYKELEGMSEKWSQYSGWLKNWYDNWTNISTFFNYPYVIRRLIYTTNTIENLNRQFRAATKTTPVFSSDDALVKAMWLAQANIAVNWNVTTHDWGAVMCQFQQMFGDRVDLS